MDQSKATSEKRSQGAALLKTAGERGAGRENDESDSRIERWEDAWAHTHTPTPMQAHVPTWAHSLTQSHKCPYIYTGTHSCIHPQTSVHSHAFAQTQTPSTKEIELHAF